MKRLIHEVICRKRLSQMTHTTDKRERERERREKCI